MTARTLTLTDFLLARIAEDEAVAREAIPGTYSPNADDDGSWRMIEVDHEGIWPEPASEWGHLADEPWAVHVELHDPARVLAECEAKRRIMEGLMQAAPTLHDGVREKVEQAAVEWAWSVAREGTLAALALPYADHPDYNPEWRP